jgi:hypothetical protein
MAWKWFKNDWSIAGFLLFFAQLAWAIYLISFVVFSIIFLIGITGMLIGTFATEPITFLDLPARFEIQDFAELVESSQSVDFFESPILELNISSIGTELQYNWSYTLANIMILGLDGIILYGLTLLKRILRSLRREEPWNKQNSKNLRVIGYLMVLAVPYKYSIGWLSYLTIEQVKLPESIALLWPPVAWELGLAGLAVLLVAYIFEEGTRLYEEQKLTV